MHNNNNNDNDNVAIPLGINTYYGCSLECISACGTFGQQCSLSQCCKTVLFQHNFKIKGWGNASFGETLANDTNDSNMVIYIIIVHHFKCEWTIT